jgi:lysyl-tRNA synthetase class 2
MIPSKWSPTASISTLVQRAEVLRALREFFYDRGVLEVETPVLGSGGATDPHLQSLETRVGVGDPTTLYLQTSPEFAMKRLLAAGSGAIFQIGKAFREGESGRLHNPEFTLLEWYRVGWDHQALMNEIDDLLAHLLHEPAGERLTYGEIFRRHLAIDPHTASAKQLLAVLTQQGVRLSLEELDRDVLLQLLMTHVVEPQMPRDRPTFVFDFPPAQAALARLRLGPTVVAERFEVYVRGIELANGYHELRDADEQRRRFARDLTQRELSGLPKVTIDEHFLAALDSGLPTCAGVALGVDRLVMLAIGAQHIDEVLTFPIARA